MTTTEPPVSGTTHELDDLRSATRAEADALVSDAGGNFDVTAEGDLDGVRAEGLEGVRAVDLGPAQPLPSRSGPATGVFVVDTGHRRPGDQQLVSLHLSPRPGDESRFAVVDVIAWEGSRLLVEAEVTVDELVALADGAGESPHRAGSLRLIGRARPAPAIGELHARLTAGVERGFGARLLDAVRRGTEAAAAPAELGVIVGPASRRHHTLVRALEQLVDADRSVLVVSSDAAGLDRLVLAADRAMGGRGPGTILRLGPATTRRVGGEPRLTVSGAAANRRPDLLRRLHEVGRELRTLLSEGDARAPGGDRPGARAPGRSTTETGPAATVNGPPGNGMTDRPRDAAPEGGQGLRRQLEKAREALHEADAAVAEAVAQAASASARHAAARQAVRDVEEARTLHHLIDELACRTEEAGREVAASAAGVGRLAAGPDRGRQLLVAAEVAVARLDRRDLALADLEKARARAAALPHTRGAVAVADRGLADARAAHAAAERATLRARAERARAVRLVGDLTRRLDGPRPPGSPPLTTSAAIVGRIGGPSPACATPTDRPAPDRTADGPGRRAGRLDPPADPHLASAGPDAAAGPDPAADPDLAHRIERLRAEYRQVRRTLSDLGPDAVRAARVVVTTFDDGVSNPAVYDRVYDNVLVEQAGRVPAAFGVWAASRAGCALTLAAEVGERPPSPAVAEAALPPEQRRWLVSNLLELLGLTTVEAVARHPSGIVLG